jgi:hypothetical protein
MEEVLHTLQSAQFIVDEQGNRTGALLDIADWELLVAWAKQQGSRPNPPSLRGYLKTWTDRSLADELIQERHEAANVE